MSPSKALETRDLVIIGSGQAASPLVRDAAAAGWKVSVIEEALPGLAEAFNNLIAYGKRT